MVALLHPQIDSPAVGPGRLRLVVDNDAPRRKVGVAEEARPLDLPLIAGLVIAAVVVFGGLALVRISQGSPSADNWEDVVGTSVSQSASAQAVAVQDAALVGSGGQIIVAKPGDTMWSLAQNLAPGSDPRPVVAALVEANGGASLQIGQQIVIPEQLLD